MRKVLFILSFFVVPTAFGEDWLLVAQSTSKTQTWEVRAGSFERTSNTTQVPVYAALFRVKNSLNSSVAFEKDYVQTAECAQGVGKLVTTDLQGKFLYASDFVFSGGNIASALAEFICEVGKPQGNPT